MALAVESSVRHYLLVQDVLSRFLWAKPMDGQAAVVEPMRQIMRVRKPEVLYTDADSAFTSRALRELGVDARVKTGRNDIATVYRAMGIVQETIVWLRSSSGKADWAEHAQRAVKAFNANDLEYLMLPKRSKKARSWSSSCTARTSTSRSTT